MNVILINILPAYMMCVHTSQYKADIGICANASFRLLSTVQCLYKTWETQRKVLHRPQTFSTHVAMLQTLYLLDMIICSIAI